MTIIGEFSPVLHKNVCCRYSLEAPQYDYFCRGFTAQSTQWGHIQCGQFT